MNLGRLLRLAAAADTTPFTALTLLIESRSREQRLSGMFRRVMLNVAFIGIVARRCAQPTPNASNTHVLGSRLTWYGASELLVTDWPRE
jgi:hypothetical protein